MEAIRKCRVKWAKNKNTDVRVLSEVIEVCILEQMRKSEHFALMFDETADCTVTEQLAIHARFIDASSGEVKSHYLKILDLLQPESTEQDVCIRMSAAVITLRIQDYATQMGLDMRKMRGIGTDGAATMIGKHNGVVTRLRAITPTAISVHCAAHRLNLASSQAANAIPYVKKFNTILRQIFAFFDNSCVRTAGLKAIQCLLQQKGSLVAPCTTRWLSIEQSVSRLRDCFASVIISLQREGEERGDAKALGLQAMVTEYRFVATMLMMCDALPHVARMSKCFQLTDCGYSIIASILATTLASLEQLKTHDGLNLSKFDAFLTDLEEGSIEIKTPANLSRDYFNDSIRIPFLSCLVENTNGRFDDKSILESFDVFNPFKLPKFSSNPSKTEIERFMAYGNTQIQTLAKQYYCDGDGTLASPHECLEEWSGYRQYLSNSFRQTKHKDVIHDLCTNPTTRALYPNMSTLAQICRVIPVHTAGVERTFSQLKLIKTRTRNRVNEHTLDSLLRIATEGPPVKDFPVKKAVQLWAQKKNRRIS